ITTGYIEFVAVRKKYRKQGIATTMLQESMLLTNYQDFVLDVTDINNHAIKCYTSIGFEELFPIGPATFLREVRKGQDRIG
ncbi:MAG: GNAT family N-acetyltransferase, partial [Lachnospiraceae bacterium]|nr:GNAT family N-acetyltransferase [Lachnospiraceae bacterium]